jgi:preprotein translocase subunit SecG
MPDIIHTLILVVHIFLAVGLVGIIVLMQRSEGGIGGLGGGGGAGGMGGFLSGRSQANVITRTTAILATGFFLTSLVLAYGDHQVRTNTTLVPSTGTTAPANKAPAAPSGSDSGNTTGTAPAPATPSAPAQPAAPSGQ